MIQKCPQAIAEGILVLAHQSRLAFTDQNRLALVYQNSEHLKTVGLLSRNFYFVRAKFTDVNHTSI